MSQKRKNSSLVVEIKEQFIKLALNLEPECLSQDGERSQEEITSAESSLKKEWAVLEAKYDVSITTEEALSWIFKETDHLIEKDFEGLLFNTIYGTVVTEKVLKKAKAIIKDTNDYLNESRCTNGLGLLLKETSNYSKDKLMNIENDYLTQDNFDLKESSLKFDRKLFKIMVDEFSEMLTKLAEK